VDLDPTLGAELRKTRPAIVISSDSVGILPIKLVVPVTEWKDSFAKNLWHIRIEPDSNNGLTKASALDILQIRGVDTSRFVTRLGEVDPVTLDEIGAAIVGVIEFDI
jgi:mRNA interferase MazF